MSQFEKAVAYVKSLPPIEQEKYEMWFHQLTIIDKASTERMEKLQDAKDKKLKSKRDDLDFIYKQFEEEQNRKFAMKLAKEVDVLKQKRQHWEKSLCDSIPDEYLM